MGESTRIVMLRVSRQIGEYRMEEGTSKINESVKGKCDRVRRDCWNTEN